MKKKWFLLTLMMVFVFFLTGVNAQKPIPNGSLEIKLPAEDETYFYNGNNRVLNRSQYPIALYQVNFKVFAATPELMARQYLLANKAVLGLTDFDIDNNLLLHQSKTDDGGTTVRLRQVYKAIEVNKNAEITIHINNQQVVDFVMNGFRHSINLDNTIPGITANTARQVTVDHLGITGAISFESNGLMVLRNNSQDYLVYKVVIACDQPVGEWESFVNAQTGTLLKLEDISCYTHKGRYQKKKPAIPERLQVNGTGYVYLPDPLTTAITTYAGNYVDNSDATNASLDAQRVSVSLLDITLNAGTYSLVGPYAAIRDFEAPSNGLFTQATSTFNFTRFDNAFEAVNTYYHIDAAMRYLNTTAGLTVMPYQYTGGVRFDPSGLSGADNSHYLSSSGSLAFGEGGVDDAEDADVIIHELGHGVHDWITAGGLSQVNGLSEGTGDYFAGSYSRAIGIWPTANAAYNWTFNWDGHNPFWGGRVLNYAAVYPGGLVNQIHTDGQIWATANMKIWDDIGRVRADKVFWRGLGVTNSSASQNDAANAVFAMATNLGYTSIEKTAIYNRYTAAGYTLPALVLPVKILSFGAEKLFNTVMVKWSVINETKGSIYTIEKSEDGRNFTRLKNVPAIADNRANDYSVSDNQPNTGINYYRLKETLTDGQTSFSDIIAINYNKKQLLQISPNPAKQLVNVSCNGLSGSTTMVIRDAVGKVLLQKKFTNITALTEMIDISSFSAGIYFVRITNNDKVMSRQLTVVK
jgi:hypothetical protein